MLLLLVLNSRASGPEPQTRRGSFARVAWWPFLTCSPPRLVMLGLDDGLWALVNRVLIFSKLSPSKGDCAVRNRDSRVAWEMHKVSSGSLSHHAGLERPVRQRQRQRWRCQAGEHCSGLASRRRWLAAGHRVTPVTGRAGRAPVGWCGCKGEQGSPTTSLCECRPCYLQVPPNFSKQEGSEGEEMGWSPVQVRPFVVP